MKKTLVVFVVILLCYGAPAAQDLPPDMLADQYLLAATTALQNQDRQAAINAFQKIEALDITPPAEFFYFYGKVLVEDGVATNTVPSIEKGQSLLKKYIVASGREVEHYRSALEVLNTAGEAAWRQREEAAWQQRQREEAARRRQEEAERAAQRVAKLKARLLEAGAFTERLLALLLKVDAQMVRIAGGTFIMGCTPEQGGCPDGEKPAHQVAVRSFELSQYEVTQELWEAVMGENPSYFKHCPRCPVEAVSWEDAQAFLQKLNVGGGRYRLPSEAEWEYAARGGQRSRGYRYAGSDSPDAVAWHGANSGDKTHPVGQKQANELGLYDLSGNVYEWVQDCSNNNYHGAPSDGGAWESGDCRRRVFRGGSWLMKPIHLRSAERERDSSDYRFEIIGFRLARSLP